MRLCKCGCGAEITSSRISPSTGRRVEFRPGHNNVTHGLTRNRQTNNQTPERRRYLKEWNQKNRHRHRGYRLKRVYGMSEADYDTMRAEQGGRCAICADQVDLVVDHDHNTGLVRGLLCDPCNRGLGSYRDDPVRLRSVAAYLEATRTGRMSSSTARA